MSHIELREVGLDDAPWIAGLLTRCRPADPVDPRVLRHQWATMRVSWWQWRSAVVVGDDPVGLATASHPPWALEPERMGRWNLSLLPAVTGLADEVIAGVEARLRDEGSRALSAGAYEDEGWLLGALGRRRYRREGLDREWELDLLVHRDRLLAMAAACRARMADQGIRLVTLDRVQDQPGLWARLTAFYAEAGEDVPQINPYHPMTEDEVRAELGGPDVRADRVWLALVGQEVAGLSQLSYPPVRGPSWTAFTGTARAFRGRGIAQAVKLESLAQAIELGVERLRTSNDARNEAMLHINDRLGYVALPSWVMHVREL